MNFFLLLKRRSLEFSDESRPVQLPKGRYRSFIYRKKRNPIYVLSFQISNRRRIALVWILPSPCSTRASKAFFSSVRSTRPSTAFVSFVHHCEVHFVRSLSKRCVPVERGISCTSWKGSRLLERKEKTCRMKQTSGERMSRPKRKDRHVLSFA